MEKRSVDELRPVCAEGSAGNHHLPRQMTKRLMNRFRVDCRWLEEVKEKS